jgi:hypothetical protein
MPTAALHCTLRRLSTHVRPYGLNLTAAGELLVSNGRAVGEDEVYLLQVRPPTLYTVQHATCSVQRAACNM